MASLGSSSGVHAAARLSRAESPAELSITDVVPGFEAETELEQRVVSDPEVLAGLAWGRPRTGHPEGAVGAHVGDLLRTIDAWAVHGRRRTELRLLTLIHDSFKSQVQEWRPKAGGNHHAMRARRFAETLIGDERLLATLELHDGPYALWRKMQRTGHLDEPAFEAMLRAVPDLDLFLQFIELDGSTLGKNPEPVQWFRGELHRRGLAG
jgi:hypothetical protein